MPNWCCAEVEVILPKENKDKFLSYFLSHNDDKNKNRKKHLARTFLNNVKESPYPKDENMVRLSISFDCAWSVISCWWQGYPQESKGECPTIEELCKKLNVKYLIGGSCEPGMGFYEQYEYTRDNGFEITEREMTKYDYLRDDYDNDFDAWKEAFPYDSEEEM